MDTSPAVQSPASSHSPADARLEDQVAAAQTVLRQAQPRPQQVLQLPVPHVDRSARDAARSSAPSGGPRRVAGARPAASNLRPQDTAGAGAMGTSTSTLGSRNSTTARPAKGTAERQAPGERRPGAARALPVVPHVVVVEGQRDAAAVRRAVRANVFVLGGAQDTASALGGLRRLLAQRGGAARDVVVLLDPDFAGRQGRQALDAALPGCRHAFVPAPCATSAGATRCAAQSRQICSLSCPAAGMRLRQTFSCKSSLHADLGVVVWAF